MKRIVQVVHIALCSTVLVACNEQAVPIGGGSGTQTNRTPSGNNAIMAKAKSIRPYADTTRIEIHKEGKLLVNNNFMQNDNWSNFLTNQWWNEFETAGTLPNNFLFINIQNAPPATQKNIELNLERAQQKPQK